MNSYASAFSRVGSTDQFGNTTYPESGLTQEQYAQIHLMAGLLANFEFIASCNNDPFVIASKAKAIANACIQQIP